MADLSDTPMATDDVPMEQRDTFRKALRLLHSGHAAGASELLEALHEQSPDDVEVALNLGGAYILQGRHDAAQPLLERAALAAPEHTNVWINLAAARLGPLERSDEARQVQAIAAYQQALATDPDAPNVHYMLGLIYRQRGDSLRSLAHFSRALDQDPADRDARRMLEEGGMPPDELSAPTD